MHTAAHGLPRTYKQVFGYDSTVAESNGAVASDGWGHRARRSRNCADLQRLRPDAGK